ncbi:16S rRNA (guanine(966)-N(2))-methyltransferase RsmD [Candidatus Vidania fulgoroideorum]
MNNFLCIQNGFLKGKKIKINKKLNIRPTKSILRSSFFNIINNHINNSVCLDLFAGSGIMGLELLSRGAKKVYFIEKNKKIFNNFIINKIKLNLSKKNIKIYNLDFKVFLKENKKKFDIIILDPPFKLLINPSFVKNCFFLLKKKGFIYFESSKNFIFKEYNVKKIGKKGKVFYYILTNF